MQPPSEDRKDLLTKVSAAWDSMASVRSRTRPGRPISTARRSVLDTLGPVFARNCPVVAPFFLRLDAEWGNKLSTPIAKRQTASGERVTTAKEWSTASWPDLSGLCCRGSPATTAHWRVSAGQASRRRSRISGRAWLGGPASSAIWVAFWESLGWAPLRSCRGSRLQASVICRSQESGLRSAGRRREVPGLSSNRWPGVMRI